MIPRNEWSKKVTLEIVFGDLYWVVEYFSVIFFLNFQDVFLLDFNEGRVKKYIFIVECWVKTNSFVRDINFARHHDISRITAIELFDYLLVLKHVDILLAYEPFLGSVFEFRFELFNFW